MQQTSDNSVVSIPFTSNKIADRDFHCERKDCKRLVHAGEAQGWFKDPMERWKRVCAECKVIYDARAAATTRRPPQISIPRLRFVEAGVFAQLSSDPKHLKSSAAGAKRTYIIEEKIQVPPHAEFTKYVHNGNPVPNVPPNDPEYNTALFLCAVQHLQYIKTHGLAYVSDFQGYAGLLTDAQIMTSPVLLQTLYGEEIDGDNAAVNLGKETLFGDGNIDRCFVRFPEEHQCNLFCTWMDLAPFDGNDQL
ncbi:hypothetical protein K435DRAFT_812496 [Dendrothele bispora CBS 962.96]|uniref:Alpha-type protein kinase domain-containing protein n=1 Tax=Dendrothele bispora (strain CBS 962.96) TaxID=1314807 RepID=A0A4S8KP25_DENBC|nr:hypothetical protein K435DRAFT_812496 [Dendrothele bispora CBS 962.96]